MGARKFKIPTILRYKNPVLGVIKSIKINDAQDPIEKGLSVTTIDLHAVEYNGEKTLLREATDELTVTLSVNWLRPELKAELSQYIIDDENYQEVLGVELIVSCDDSKEVLVAKRFPINALGTDQSYS